MACGWGVRGSLRTPSALRPPPAVAARDFRRPRQLARQPGNRIAQIGGWGCSGWSESANGVPWAELDERGERLILEKLGNYTKGPIGIDRVPHGRPFSFSQRVRT